MERIGMDILYLVVGLALVILGANWLTDGAASMAKRLRLSDLFIGLTVVAFGTSAPELVVSVASAIQKSPDLAVGNVVGSNIFNTLMIVGVTALCTPLFVKRESIKMDIPVSILAAVILWVLLNSQIFDGGRADNVISRSNGVILLIFFLIFLIYTIALARNKDGGEEGEKVKVMPLWKSILMVLGGLVCLVGGAKVMVMGATGLAKALGVSEAIIGLTIVAAGTSIPELATSVVAALKKNPQIAVGNVVGSNIFNIFLILGLSSTIYPLQPSGIDEVDLWVLIGSGVLLLIFSCLFGNRVYLNGDRKNLFAGVITRVEGAILLLCYVAYMIWLCVK